MQSTMRAVRSDLCTILKLKTLLIGGIRKSLERGASGAQQKRTRRGGVRAAQHKDMIHCNVAHACLLQMSSLPIRPPVLHTVWIGEKEPSCREHHPHGPK